MGPLVNLFNPQLIVLGGSVIKAGNFLLGPMRRSMNVSSWKAARRGLRIVRPALGDDVGLIGAVEYARLRARHARLAEPTGASRLGAPLCRRARARRAPGRARPGL